MGGNEENKSLDLIGFGKLAQAIPEEVYTRSAGTLLTTFERLIAPITETTGGFGRYIRQKFDNMVAIEKAIATYTVEKALLRAEAKARKAGTAIRPPLHPKSFVKGVEEASKETDPLLHEMWTNLLASQLIDDQCHPHFIEILPHFSPIEAKILVSLFLRSEVGENRGKYLGSPFDDLKYWIKKAGENDLKPWTISCVLLCEFQFADVVAAPRIESQKELVGILYRTATGENFLRAVTP